jgi:hypothetical protein
LSGASAPGMGVHAPVVLRAPSVRMPNSYTSCLLFVQGVVVLHVKL